MKFLGLFSKRKTSKDNLPIPNPNGFMENLNQFTKTTQRGLEAYPYNQLQEYEQLTRIISLNLIRETCERLEYLLRTASNPNLYLVGSLFLRRSYENLQRHQTEHLFYVTGTRMGNLFTLDYICEFKVASASRVHADGDTRSTHITLINLDNVGHQVHGLFHKHPGTGALVTMPSGIDRETQRRMERGGYPIIGAIFSEDGFVRFFAVDRGFEIRVYGKGVSHVEDNIFKIDEICEIPD
jgi:hypothetical protein